MPSLPESHPTSLVFLDESGWTAKERFLAVGALKLRDPNRIERQLSAYRRDAKFSGRLRWASLATAGEAELIVARRALQLICTDVECDFACAILDRATSDIKGIYGNVWEAYSRLATRALGDVLDSQEVAAVIADRFDSPRSHQFEKPVTRMVNDRKGRLALTGIQQAASGSVEGLQLTDLLLGAITYQVRETHVPGGAVGARMQLSLEVMQRHYQQRSYLRQGPGQLEINHLRITVLPLPRRGRGKRGGRRR